MRERGRERERGKGKEGGRESERKRPSFTYPFDNSPFSHSLDSWTA